MKKIRLGIYGGTFNPPHIGHIQAAKAFVDNMKLDRLLVIPTYLPPHKEYTSSVTCDDRFHMCRIAFSDVNKTEVSDIEIIRGGASYTYLTLQDLKNEDTELFFLCGTDMILSMDKWKNPEIIFKLANICFIRRENDQRITQMIRDKCLEYKTKFNANIYQINAEIIDISSSEIRNAGQDTEKYLTDSVKQYISKKGLYK